MQKAIFDSSFSLYCFENVSSIILIFEEKGWKYNQRRCFEKMQSFCCNDFERNILRIDGLEMYALVMATIAGFSFSAMESVTREEVKRVGFFWRLAFGISTCLSFVLSLYSTVIFALSSLYAKTALGLHKDIEYDAFLLRTQKLRIYGFHAFICSCGAFIFCFLILIHIKIEGIAAILSGTLGVGLFYIGWKNTAELVQAANPIFMKRPSGVGAGDPDDSNTITEIINPLERSPVRTAITPERDDDVTHLIADELLTRQSIRSKIEYQPVALNQPHTPTHTSGAHLKKFPIESNVQIS